VSALLGDLLRAVRLTIPRVSFRVVSGELSERFEILALAGSGGMGEVHRARDRQSGTIVAIKTLTDGASAERFEREARVLSAIDHPGVVKHLDHGVTPAGVPYLVMEWLTGEDLDGVLKRGPLSIEQTMRLALGLADALSAAHRHGIVHRDLKPANVFLLDGKVDNVKILDFGIALPSDFQNQLTVPGTVLGTPAYMAPEQVRGDTIDARADVYALGGLLFRCLTGRAPFGGAHAIAILAKVVMEAPPRIAEVRADVPSELDALIIRMLAKDPAKRPRDADQVRSELSSIDLTVREERPAEPAVSNREQRVTCVVLCAASTADAVTLGAKAQADQLARVRQAVEQQGGVLDSLHGANWLVTVRDASTPTEQAARAAHCALALSELRPNAPVVLAMGRILVTGDVQVGEVIDRASTEVIARLQRGDHGVVVDDDAAALLASRFEFEARPRWRRLVRERPHIVPRTLLGRPAQCIGRAQEVALLSGQIDDSIENRRFRSVLVSAGPGLGKSRLVQELLFNTLPTRDVETLIARGDAMRAGSPFGLVAQLIGSEPGLDAVLGALTAPSVRAAARADVAMIADTVRDAFIDWLRARLSQKAHVMIVEDVQWADLPSLRLLDGAAEALAAMPWTIVATSRKDEGSTFRDLLRTRGLQEIQLGPLSKRAAERLVRDALATAPNDVVEAIVSRAAGHPFHLEELVRAVASGRGADALPDTVLGMVQSRLDLIGPELRRVLRAASVLGETFWTGAIRALLGDAVTESEVHRHLAALTTQELVTKRAHSRFAGEQEYAFRHALVRDAAYAMLTDSDRRVAHYLCGGWLETAGDRDAAVLAEHFDRGGSGDRARPHYRRAAEQALEGNDLERARRFVHRALALGAEGAERAALFAIEAEIAFWRGELDVAIERARAALHDLPIGRPEWLTAVSAAIGGLGQRGRNDDVADWLEWAAIASVPDDARGAQATTLCRGLLQLDWAHHRGDLTTVRANVDTLAEQSDDPYVAGWVHRARGEAAWIHARDMDRALAELDLACDAFERARAARALCLTRANRASLAGWAGAVDRALADIDRARAEAERLRSPFLTLYSTAVKALTLAFAGDPLAEATMREALTGLAGSPRLAFISHVVIGWLRLDAGDVAAAEASARAAIALPVVVDLAPAGPALLALALLAKGDPDGARAAARESETLQSGARDLELLIGLSELAIATVEQACGDEARAREATTRGGERLRAIAATIADPAQRAAFLSRKLPNDRISTLAALFAPNDRA